MINQDFDGTLMHGIPTTMGILDWIGTVMVMVLVMGICMGMGMVCMYACLHV